MTNTDANRAEATLAPPPQHVLMQVPVGMWVAQAVGYRFHVDVVRDREPKNRGRRMPPPTRTPAASRYGRVTVVPSPLLEIENTPVAVLAVSVYAAQPEGGAGTLAMNGPATWF